MASDPSTLLQCIAALCTLAALGFAAGARFCMLSPVAARRWSLANLLFGAGSLLTILRADVHAPWLFALADALELACFALQYAGFVAFVRQPSRLSRHLIAVGLVSLLLWQAYAAGAQTARLAIYCALAAAELGLAARVAYRGLRAEFNPRAAAIIAAPLSIACALQVGRALVGLTPHSRAAEPLVHTDFNVLVLWVGFGVAFALNAVVAGFIGARQVARINALTITDTLTSALNRRGLVPLLDREIGNLSRHGQPLSIVYLDLDHFKQINDHLGHAAGDAALLHVAELLRGLCRRGDTVARVGGEEFCVVLPYTGLDGACLLAERMRTALAAAPLHWRAQTLQLTGSFGVACTTPGEADHALELLERGDRAMYEAKLAGRNCVASQPRWPRPRESTGAQAVRLPEAVLR